jgi:hypothetical protein
VRHEANQSSQGFAWFHRGDNSSEPTSSGTGRSIRQSRSHAERQPRPSPVTRDDRELLAELARLNREMTSLAMRITEGNASTAEQQDYAQRLITAGERLWRRADGMNATVLEGEVLTNGPLLPRHTAEPYLGVEDR